MRRVTVSLSEAENKIADLEANGFIVRLAIPNSAKGEVRISFCKRPQYMEEFKGLVARYPQNAELSCNQWQRRWSDVCDIALYAAAKEHPEQSGEAYWRLAYETLCDLEQSVVWK